MKTTYHFDLSTYCLIVLSFFCGLYKKIIILYFIILFHELGHLIILRYYHIPVKSVTIYPFGGYIKTESLLNHSIIPSLLIACGGILNQIFLFLIVLLFYKYRLISITTYNIFLTSNFYLLVFNLLPLIPLDGSKIIHLLLESLFPYHLSYVIYEIIGLISFFLFTIYLFPTKLNYIILLFFLFLSLFDTFKNQLFLENKFLLERYLYHLPYKKITYVKDFNPHLLKQETFHYFNYQSETKKLQELFDKGSIL